MSNTHAPATPAPGKPAEGAPAGERKRAAKPRHAASLVLLREGPKGREVLMGQRAAGHKFMPNRVVFPGGRVDPQDARVPQGAELQPEVMDALTRAAPPGLARRLALAAIRETFEETGLILGRKLAGPPPAKLPEGWRDFYARGFQPALDALDIFLRAVTPPTQPIRFNARFFVADASLLQGDLVSNGELHFLQWYPVEEALRLDLARITRNVLEELNLWLEARPRPGSRRVLTVFSTWGAKRTRGQE